MPRATDPKPPTVDQIKVALIKGAQERGDEVFSVRADQLKQCLIAGCDEDLLKDVTDAGEGFLEVTGNEVLEAIGEAHDKRSNNSGGSGGGGKPARPAAAKAEGQARKNVAGGGDSSGSATS